MDLAFTEEQNILQTSARSFLKKECPPSLLKEMSADELGYPQQLWGRIIELGWLGVMIPEEYGGIGGDFLDLCIIMECMGEVCCPGPFFSTVVLGGTAIQSGGSEELKSELLPRLVNGELILALAVMESGAWYDTAGITAKAKEQDDAFIIEGSKTFVENAHISDTILCAAKTGQEQGISLFLVEGKSKGVHCTLLDTLAYDKQYEVIFDKVEVPASHMIGKKGTANDLLSEIQEKAAVAKCAEMVGNMQTVFDMTLAYAKEREQFGRPIGVFQAVQHHCANMKVDLDGARFMTYQAAWKISQGLPATKEAAMAKAWTSEASRRVTMLGHQIHGAVSFCDEHDLHLFYRKAKASAVSFGDEDYHLEKIAEQLGL
jgi:alkylation response protein AidB-like acyl-CoA dehydrogenase